VRSVVVLVAAAAVFGLFLVRNQRRADDLVRAEREALSRLRALVEAPPGPPHVAEGYRYEWLLGGDLPPLLIATPERTGIDGVCRFAAAPQGAVYVCDPLASQSSRGFPDATPLRVRLARPAPAAMPLGWRQLE
jgi:hypothetical protein